MEYIDVNKEELPERFDIDLADETFTLQFSYNETGDFFSVDLYRPDNFDNDIPLILGEKLTLNQPLWSDFSSLDLPAPSIVPMDLAKSEGRLTWDNFGSSVFLYIVDEVDTNE
ncbi:phage baseplate plug family protein [Fictibacillus sp. JL2B1089]|uniref:phage baseplate plug family protein n=1 Tax=Fictibacillus sp. JL2B1089 TaxID=3399565 RepID=UPI003A894BDA